MEVVDTILDEPGMLAEKAERIQAILRGQLRKMLSAAPPKVFAELNGFVLGVVIAGQDEEEPILKLHYLRFTQAPDGTLLTNLTPCPGAGCPKGMASIVERPDTTTG